MPIKWFRGRDNQNETPADLESVLDRFLRLESPAELEAWVTGHPVLLRPEAAFLLREKCQSPPQGVSPARVLERMKWLLARQNQGSAARAVTETTPREGPRLVSDAPNPAQPAAPPRNDRNNLAARLPEHVRNWIAEIAQARRTPENAPGILARCERILADPAVQKEPLVKALVLNEKAKACFLSYRGDVAEFLETGIQALLEAARLVQQQDLPELWGDIQANTGLLYLFRLKGDPQQNLVWAIDYLERALLVFRAASHPEAFASAHNNLGTACFRRILPGGKSDTGAATAHYEQALAAIDRAQQPELWGDIHNNLAGVYTALGGEHNRQAAAHYRLALETLTEARSRQKYAQAHFNLAWLLLQQKELAAAELDEALAHANRALEACPYQAWPELWGKVRLALGMIYSIRSTHRPEELETAEMHFRRALSLFTPETQPQLCLAAALLCGEMFFNKGRTAQARAYLALGHAALEAARSELAADLSKREVAQKAALLYPLLIRCCLAENDLAAAYEYASAVKGRAFIETLQGLRLDMEAMAAQDAQYGAIWQKLRGLQARIGALRQSLLGEDPNHTDDTPEREPAAPPEQAVAEIRGAMRGMSELWEELLLKYPLLHSVQPSRPLSAEKALALARQTGAVLVEFLDTGQGWGAFVVDEDLRYISLPGLTPERIARLERWVRAVEQPAGRGGLSYRVLRELYGAVFQPLAPHLDPARLLVLAPHGPLHLVPLAAAQNPESLRFAGEEYRMGFAPNLNALNILAEKQIAAPVETPHDLRFLGVAWPGQPGSAAYLENARLEVESIARLFPGAGLLIDRGATISGVLQSVDQRDVIHFGCHGWFERDYPEQSGLMLADGWLTTYRILTELRMQARLVTVGACLSGQARLRTGDEFTGLTQALLSSGAGAVASSLWSVHDQAARVFFEYCYRQIAAGASICEAVWAAAQEVRRQPGWQHPYYWAAFQVSGLSTPGRALAHTAVVDAEEPVENSGTLQRGGWWMDMSLLVANMQTVIDEMIENPAEIMGALEPSQRMAFLDALDRTAGEANLVTGEQSLYQWAGRFAALLDAYPPLKALLMEEGSSLSGQIMRKISQSQFSGSAAQNSQAQQSAVQMRNAVLDCREKLLQSMGGARPGSQSKRPS